MSKEVDVSIWSFRNSWPAYITALILAFFISMMASMIAYITGGAYRATFNASTFFWVFLTIKAWRVWQFKALIPYPAMIRKLLM